jgi:hypothetical protein
VKVFQEELEIMGVFKMYAVAASRPRRSK